MDRKGFSQMVVRPDLTVKQPPVMDFGAGYVKRALNRLPKQGDRWPWRLSMSYPWTSSDCATAPSTTV